jgi:hypothetical protein
MTGPLDLAPYALPLPYHEPRAPLPGAKAIAFADRESDLAPMTILVEPDGLVVARRRLPEDRIVPSARVGSFDDQWLHVGSNGRYTRHDQVLDVDLGLLCYDYSSWMDGRLVPFGDGAQPQAPVHP